MDKVNVKNRFIFLLTKIRLGQSLYLRLFSYRRFSISACANYSIQPKIVLILKEVLLSISFL